MPGAPVEPGGMDPEEDLAASGRWPADLRQMQNVGGTYPACTIARIVCRRDTGPVPPPVSPGVAARPAAPAAAFMIVFCAGSVVRGAFS
jgi:hypothetical protein